MEPDRGQSPVWFYLIPAVLEKYIRAEGVITKIQYHNVLSRVRVNTPRYNSSSAEYLFKLLGKKGFDSIAFMSDRYDSGSIGFIVFDESQLIPVAIDGLPVENSDRTLADSENEPAFLMTENDGENFVEKGKENEFDS